MRLTRPSHDEVRALLEGAAVEPFTYAEVGATRQGETPPGYRHLRHQVDVPDGGTGKGFDAARAALLRWDVFPDWVDVTPAGPPVPGTAVLVLARVLGVWARALSRVIYRIDEPDRLAFAYGTLPLHVAQGEERFAVERDGEGRVTYSVESFSRFPLIPGPNGPVLLVAPLARAIQRRFLRDSGARVLALAASAAGSSTATRAHAVRG